MTFYDQLEVCRECHGLYHPLTGEPSEQFPNVKIAQAGKEICRPCMEKKRAGG